MTLFLFSRCQVSTMVQFTIQRSAQLPLVSSFYHIGTVVGQIAEKLKYFSTDADSGRQSQQSLSSDIPGLREEYSIFARKVCGQLRFYKDELLVASAEFVLSTPLSLISVDAVVPALLSTLAIGKSYLPAAEIGVSALERWQKICPDQLEAALPAFIPLLSPYLSRSDEDMEQQQSSAPPSKNSVTTSDEEGVTEFGKLQRRILVLLGNTGGVGSLLISKLSSSSGESESTAGRYAVPQFQLSVELSDASVSLTLDKIMAQVGEVAVYNTDRRIKIGACETYHALMCFLCGKTATHPHSSASKSVFYQIWKKAFPTVLVLATDAEKVCRALFEPLLFQVVRWLCSSSDVYPFEFSMILDELVTGLSQAGNSAVREISGKALAAALSASIETEEKTGRSIAKAEVIFERLFSLCQHPSSIQRIGAATAINHVMRSLNQDNSKIISAFALRCVKTFLFSLRLCDRDDQNGRGGMNIARGIIQRAISKLERAISRYPHLFLKKKEAPEQSGLSPDTCLEDMVEWLFSQSMKRERAFREMCQKLFLSFASLVSGAGCRKWMLNYSAQGANIASILAPMDSLARVLSSFGKSAEDTRGAIEWMEQFAASAEAYSWCIMLLGDEAGAILSITSEYSSKGASKRKNDLNDNDNSSGQGQQHTFAWAISNFLSFEYPARDVAAVSDTTDYVRHKNLVQSYGAVLVSLCRLITPVFSSKSQSLSWLVDTEAHEFRAKFVRRIVPFMAGSELSEWNVNSSHAKDVTAFCSVVMSAGGAFADELRDVALEFLDPMVRSLDQSQDLTDSKQASAAVKSASAFLIQVSDCCLSMLIGSSILCC